jgi:5'-nucleotidase
MRNLRLLAIVGVLGLIASACGTVYSANRHAAAPGTVPKPFWCAPVHGASLNATDCQTLSAQLDLSLFAAHAQLQASNALANGYSASGGYVPGVGAALRRGGPTAAFDYRVPDTLLYDSVGSTAQVAGMEWNVASSTAPEGFAGPNDEWTETSPGVWRLRVWMLRPFQNQPNLFADSHPCLGASGAIYSLTDPCYTSTHPVPTEILVSDDDGYAAPGIDAVVEALQDYPNVHITVSAPLIDRSGTGGTTSPDPLVADLLTTQSGYPAYAVHGYPADSVRYALKTLHVNPELLVSGINAGQNLGPVIPFSGTVGAARVGGRNEIPSVALSQGMPPSTPDYASGVAAMQAWVNDFLFGRNGPARFETVTNINIPTCTAGTIRGTLKLPASTSLTGVLSAQDCTSTATGFTDDVAAFNNGFVTVTSIGT